VKTMVMMTSEFEYTALFDEEHSKELAFSFQIVRLIFVVFLILAAIVLMNLMVGVAVNDINDLEILGNIRRLDKQVEFLSTLDTLVYNKAFSKILPRKANNKIKNKRNVNAVVVLRPSKPRWRYYKSLPSRIRDAIFNKAQSQKKQQNDEMDVLAFKVMLKDIHDAVITKKENKQKEQGGMLSIEEKRGKRQRHDEVMKILEEINDDMVELKDRLPTAHEEYPGHIDALHSKVEQMAADMNSIKEFLLRLESKLEKL
jgi:hypothetical protein